MRTELIIDGNAVYEIDIDCKERHLAETGFSDEKELRQMAFPSCKNYRDIWGCVLLILLILAAERSDG